MADIYGFDGPDTQEDPQEIYDSFNEPTDPGAGGITPDDRNFVDYGVVKMQGEVADSSQKYTAMNQAAAGMQVATDEEKGTYSNGVIKQAMEGKYYDSLSKLENLAKIQSKLQQDFGVETQPRDFQEELEAGLFKDRQLITEEEALQLLDYPQFKTIAEEALLAQATSEYGNVTTGVDDGPVFYRDASEKVTASMISALDNATKAKSLAGQLNGYIMGRSVAELMSLGYTQEDVDLKTGALSQIARGGGPVEAPDVDIDFNVFFTMYGALKGTKVLLSAAKAAGKEITKPRVAKAFAKSLIGAAGIEAATESAITGTQYALQDFGTLTGVMGSLGAGGVMALTEAGLKLWAQRTFVNNKKLTQEIMGAQAAHQTSAIGKLQSFLKEMESGKVSTRAGSELFAGESEPMIQAMIKHGYIEQQDEGVVRLAVDTVRMGLESPNSPIGDLAKKTLGTGDGVGLSLMDRLLTDEGTAFFGEFASSDLPQLVKNTDNYFRTIVPEVVYTAENQRQVAVKGYITDHLYKDGTFDTDPIAFAEGKALAKAKGPLGFLRRWLREPKVLLDKLNKRLVDGMNDRKFMLDSQMSKFQDAHKAVVKGLNKEQTGSLDNILTLGSETQETFKIGVNGLVDEAGNVLSRDPNVMDAYFAARMLNDQMGHVLNGSLVDIANGRGWKKFSQTDEIYEDVNIKSVPNDTVDLNGVTLTREMKDSGWTAHRAVDPTGTVETTGKFVFLKDGEAASKLTKIPLDYKLMTKLEGHIGRYYKDPFMVSRVKFDSATQKFKVIETRTAPTSGDAHKFMKKVEDTDGELVDGEFMLAFRQGSGGSTNVRTARTEKMMSGLSDEQRTVLYESLLDGGVDEELIKHLFTFTEKKKVFGFKNLRERGERLQSVTGGDAPIMPATEAMARYASSVMSFSQKASLTERLTDAMKKTYRDVLVDPDDWSRIVTRADTRAMATKNNRLDSVRFNELEAKRKEAKIVRDQINAWVGSESDLMAKDRIAFEGIADTIYNSKKFRAVADISPAIDKMATMVLEKATGANALRLLRSMESHTKLGLWGVGQVIVQSTALVNLGAKLARGPMGAKNVAAGMSDLTSVMLNGRIADRLNIPIATEEATYLLSKLRESGYVARLNFDDLDMFTRNNYGKRSVVGRLWDTNTWFFKEGEGFGRAGIWFTERRQLIDEVMAGKMKGMGKGDIDSRKFLLEVNKRADVLAHNFSNLNRSQLLRSGGGVMTLPLQFQQFTMKQLELFFGGKLSGKEKWALFATWGALFGSKAIPFNMDVVTGTEYAAAYWNRDPAYIGKYHRVISKEIATTMTEILGKDEKFWTRFIEKGAISAVSEGDIDLAHRVGLGVILDNYLHSKTLDELIGGPSLSTIKHAATELVKFSQNRGSIYEITTIMDIMEGEPLADKARSLVSPIRELIRPVSSIYNLAKAGQAALTGDIKTGSGRVALEEPTLAQILLQAASISPGQIRETQEIQNILFNQTELYRKWHREKVVQLARLTHESPKVAEVMLDEYVTQLGEVNPALLKRFIMDYQSEVLFFDLPPETKLLLKTWRNKWLPAVDTLPLLEGLGE